MKAMDLDGFVIDLDGTVFRGEQVVEGAQQAIASLRAAGKRLVFLSNRGNISREMCLAKLRRLGVEASLDEIILSSTVTARYLREHHPGCEAWTLGDWGLQDELAAGGITLAVRPELADWLVITLHETLTYHELNEAFRAVRHGARIIATNEDRSFPGEFGDHIDVAGMIGAIAASTGAQVELVVGKPSLLMAEAALAALQLPAERCLMIGDSLASDIGLGKRSGMKTALVLTGSTTTEAAGLWPARPDWIWSSIGELTTKAAVKGEGMT
ncbi:HAD-superfamily hydrolase, subfamily IIA [Paenibacillus curdlanolyticus YK9]|uniref:HAD-superfamily hydrolase, subfamily IIA n=1 Tax=Paenibacillus curdlanolyticus YK9 TaxID=717606 RepID=E0I4T1_9BACL|nr:HAD-IIA family hydrolase [Paenibacillus curdlanolyticus]EFM12612.1 HAD-superfamily hydrolase, subfamily IIA [Paenibacillus curdlanolyticus YK9]